MKLVRKINGVKWTFEVLTAKEMKKQKAGDANAGLTVIENKIVYLDEDYVDFKTVAHELFHVYFSNCYLDDTNEMKLSDVEEVAAALFSDRGEEIIKKSKKIVKDLNKLTESDNG